MTTELVYAILQFKKKNNKKRKTLWLRWIYVPSMHVANVDTSQNVHNCTVATKFICCT